MKKMMMFVLVLMLILAGCGGEQIAGQVEELPAVTESSVVDKPVTLGRLEGGIYTNHYLGISCQLDENWTFYTAEELQELPQQVNDLLQDTDFADAALNQINDMKAENAELMATINLLYRKMELPERLHYATMNEEQVVEEVLAQEESLVQAYNQAGITVEHMEKRTVTFCGQTRVMIHTTASVEGYPYYILQMFGYDLGQYGATLTFSSFFEDHTEAMLELFYPAQ